MMLNPEDIQVYLVSLYNLIYGKSAKTTILIIRRIGLGSFISVFRMIASNKIC